VNKKMLLISPKRSYITYEDYLDPDVKALTKKSEGMMVASLATIAAITPPQFEIKIIDESIERINFDEFYDLVCFRGLIPTPLPLKSGPPFLFHQ
jgi:hypothetical protein